MSDIVIKFTADRAIMAAGLFDTDNQYIRKVANPVEAIASLCDGETMDFRVQNLAVSPWTAFGCISWRYDNGGATVGGFSSQYNGTSRGTAHGTPPASGFSNAEDIGL